MNEFGQLRLEVNVPGQKFYAATQLLVDAYKPLVEQALEEAKQELMEDDTIRATIKEALKTKVKNAVIEELSYNASRSARSAVRDIDFDGIAKDILKEMIKY